MRGAEADVLDRTAILTGLAEITQPNRFVPNEKNAAEKVFNGFLSGKGHGNAAKAETGHHGREIDARKIMKHDHESHGNGQYLEQRCRKADDRIGRLVPAPLNDLRKSVDHMDGQPCEADNGHRCSHEIPKQLGNQRKDAPAQYKYDDGRKEQPERIFPSFQFQHERFVKMSTEPAAYHDDQQCRKQPSPQERHGEDQDGDEPVVDRIAGYPGFHEDRRQPLLDSGDVNLLKHPGNEFEGLRGEEPDLRVVFLPDAIKQEPVFPSFCLDTTDDLTMIWKVVLEASFGVRAQRGGRG